MARAQPRISAGCAAAYLERKPVDFFTEAIGEGYFAQVLIAKLEVSQQAGYPDQFDFGCAVVEYVEPPEPVTADPFASLDAGLRRRSFGTHRRRAERAGGGREPRQRSRSDTGLRKSHRRAERNTGRFTGVAGGAGGSLQAISDLF